MTNEMCEVMSRNQLHRVVMNAGLCSDGKHRNDIRMLQLSSRARFILESLNLSLIHATGNRQRLQRNSTIERGLCRFIHNPHSSTTNLPNKGKLADRSEGLSILFSGHVLVLWTDDVIVDSGRQSGSNLFV